MALTGCAHVRTQNQNPDFQHDYVGGFTRIFGALIRKRTRARIAAAAAQLTPRYARPLEPRRARGCR
jgi:hypothetical protein